ncbi:DUF86 domain-containing protein [Candidatus Oscillochloris fontis]|uniref:HepT-like ribonuclease domain-containing protein n=1 Tax=Candidatus Oscillochloris fontis TaxID=2496868 RepID=UPI001584270C|nr:DUF86 domain-containing protein [Candidatus Oscillochloris fontis]
MKPSDTIYLRHILDALTTIERYITDVDEATFFRESLIQDDVIRQMMIIGEAVKQLTPATRQQAPHITWSAIAGMRDKLIHHYFGVDLSQVWLTTKDDLPMLKMAVTTLLAKR